MHTSIFWSILRKNVLKENKQIYENFYLNSTKEVKNKKSFLKKQKNKEKKEKRQRTIHAENPTESSDCWRVPFLLKSSSCAKLRRFSMRGFNAGG